MDKTERAILLVLCLAVIAWLVMHLRPIPAQDAIVEAAGPDTSMAEGPNYLIYNMPWAFSPPVGNILPQRSAGLLGQNIAESIDPTSQAISCGCGG